jgi:hypothetical protein
MKIFFLYGLILTTMAIFIKMIAWVYWWIGKISLNGKLTIKPLDDPYTNSWYWYLTDRINPVVVWGGRTKFGIKTFLYIVAFLIFLPLVAFTGFVIGYLFSLMGDDRCGKLQPPGSSPPSSTLSPSSMLNKAKGLFSSLTGKGKPAMTTVSEGVMNPLVTGVPVKPGV